MSAEEEEQFARDVAKALELSRITAAQDNDRRKKLGLVPMFDSEDGGNDYLMHGSQSAPSLAVINNGSYDSTPTEPTRPMRPPAPSPRTVQQDNMFDLPPPSTRNNSITSSNNGSVKVRPRPRPSSGGRAGSPADLSSRRSGFIESSEGDKLRISSPTMESRPKTPTEPPIITTQPVAPAAARNHDTIWEDFLAQSSQPAVPTQLHNANPFDQPSSNNGASSTCLAPSSSTNPFDMDFLQIADDTKRDRADSASNLIALSPMDKDKLNQHYKLDLDSLFSGGRTGTSTPPPTQHTLPQSLPDQASLSLSWPNGGMNSNTNTVIPRPSSPSKNVTRTTGGGGTNLPPPVPPARTHKPENPQSTRESIKSSRTSFDINQFFGEFLNTAGAKPQTPSPTASSSNLHGLPMPAGRAPTLPPPPPIPARPGSQTNSIKKPSIQVKRVSTPKSDLLDLGDGFRKVPEVQSLDLFDPLFTPSADAKRDFEQHITNLNEKLASQPTTFEMTHGGTDEGEDDEEVQKLQDPFSYEELSMALVTASRIKGDDVSLVDEDEDEEEEEITADIEESIYETIPSSPDVQTPSQTVPVRPPKPRSLSVTSPKSLRITNVESMDEFTAFSVMVARLKADYRYDDKYTNLGILFSPTVTIPAPQGLTVDITVFTEMSREPIEFKTDVTTSVEILVWTVMSNISADFLEISVDDYILKVFNYSEYLVNDSSLCDYAYIHECLKLKEPIRFSLHSVNSLPKPFLRKPGDDEEPIYMIKDELHGDKSYKVQPKDLKLLYDVFCKQAESVNKNALERGLAKLNVTTLLQSVKAITSVLLGAETLEIKTAIKQLKSALSQINNSIYDDRQFAVLMDVFQRSMESLSTGVKNIIKMYCATFHVNYNPSDHIDPPREIQEVTDSLENILVHVGSVHRIPAHIRGRFDNFKIIVSLFYAGSKVCEHISTDVYPVHEGDRSSDSIYFDQWLELTDYPMCLVPVETRVMFTLCAMNLNLPVGGSGANTPNKWNNIGWVSFMLFDFKRNVTQGNKLLSLWQGTPNPVGATGSNIWQANTTLLQVDLPDFGFELRFPSSLVDSPSRRPQSEHGEPDLGEGDLKEFQAILAKDDEDLDEADEEFMWSKRENLRSFPEALPKVLLSAPEKNYTGVHLIQDMLDGWAPITALDSLRLLLSDFPCSQIRNHAVRSLKNVSSDEMCDYLPQLVQALKFENYHDSALARLLLERSITSVRLAQQLYWALKDGASHPAYRERYKLLFGGLVSVMGKSLREEVEREELLVKRCHNLAELVKNARSENRDKVKNREIQSISDLLNNATLRLPTNPGHEVNGLDLNLCTYFNSFTVPLKLVFRSVEVGAPNHYLMYKSGDDLRQDMLVMQLINIMDKLWLQSGLDMRIVTFTCLPTGDKRGMVELITECETLRKIQTMGGITGSFKDQPLANWLQKHNPTHADYNKAVENFTLSCAGYCVATYILGIGDRHNDNIMVKRTGHIFHIDFSKFLGDAQMFGNFKRDRTPFVLTADMAYVINGGDKPTQKFQDFVDLCCGAFNAIRENADGIITLLKMMTSSGVKGVTSSAVDYVRSALLPEQTNSEATASFTRMIEESLKSKFVQFNFFIHNLAQLKFSSHSDGELLSFIPTTYSMATDGRIINVEIFDYQKRHKPEKHYIYIIKVHRERQKESSLVYRRYSEFQEFYSKLVSLFPMANLPKLPGSILLGRTHVQKVAEKRKAELETFLRELLTQAHEISEHDLLYTFFHPMLRDEKEVVPPESNIFKDTALRPNIRTITGEVKLAIHYKQHALHIMVMHVKGLSNESGDRPNPYVKLYLIPDAIKTTKRKTKVVRASFHPTYNEMMDYRLPLSEIRQRTLQVTIWSAEMTGNEFLGAVHINLYDIDLSKEWSTWHHLSALHRIRF